MAWKAPIPNQSPTDPPTAESSPLIDGVSISVIVICTVSEKVRTMLLFSSCFSRPEISLVLVPKVLHGIGQSDNLFPLYKLSTLLRYPGVSKI